MSTQTRRPRPTVPVPEAIKAAALELFVAHGYENTSVDQIVAAAGVTKGAMYHHFTSKNDLLFDIYDRLLTTQSAHLIAIASGPGTARERLRASAVDVITTSLAARAEATVFFRSRHLLQPASQEEFAARRREYSRVFAALLAEGVAEGSVRADLPPVAVEGYFFGAVHYLAEWYDERGPLSPDRVADIYADLLLSSVAPGVAPGVAPDA